MAWPEGLRLRNERTRLRVVLLVLFLAMTAASAVLVYQAYEQMRWETYHQHRLQAEELVNRIDDKLAAMVDVEEGRSFADYDFLVVSGDVTSNFVQPSALSKYPVASAVPGLVGYFQVDMNGEFSTPLLPESRAEAESFGIGVDEYEQRLALGQKVHGLLSAQNLVRRREVSEDVVDERLPAQRQAAFDDSAAVLGQTSDAQAKSVLAAPESESLAYGQEAFRQLQQLQRAQPAAPAESSSQLPGRVDEMQLDSDYLGEKHSAVPEPELGASRIQARVKRKEQVALPSVATEGAAFKSENRFQAVPISTFDIEVEPFSIAVLDRQHLVMFRRVFRDGDRFVQGGVIDERSFFRQLIDAEFSATALSRFADLTIGLQGNVLRVLSHADAPSGSLLYRVSLSAPFSDMELVFSVTDLPIGPGARTLIWSATVLSILLVLGFFLIYRLGIGQINLNRQQRDFVAAVSHELKTPLTSIRMYGEMLREGWVGEDKRKTYYDFIFHESERLSRLIANVLELARLTRNTVKLELKSCTVGEVLDLIRSKVSTQVEHAGFTIVESHGDDALDAELEVDTDALSQVIINLVDNALKFSAGSQQKIVELRTRRQTQGELMLSVRDYGPGVARSQLRKIFKLFYRTENELTRETVGTGIGLALVHQLVAAMRGRVDVVNREPGAEFRVFLPVVGQPA